MKIVATLDDALRLGLISRTQYAEVKGKNAKEEAIRLLEERRVERRAEQDQRRKQKP